MVRYAWVSDDAHIILRTIDNFYHGYGLRWNPAERVQAFTCPLWTLLLSVFYFITGEGYYTTIVVSLAVSLYTVYYVGARAARTVQGAVLGTAVLLLSRAFIDYSTSGLENPLTHLLIAVYCVVAARAAADKSVRSFRRASLIFALLIINRMDTVLLLGPSLFYLWWIGPNRFRRATAAIPAFLPAMLWFGFSLFYYGFILPNTAYAKLSTGISSPALWLQGLFYLRNSLSWDPITLSAVAAAVAATVLYRRPGVPLPLLIGAGMVLHVLYTARVGGDHMAGRFLTPMFVTAAVLIAAYPFRETVRAAVLLVLFLALGFMGTAPTLGFKPEGQGGGLDAASIADERGFCFQHYGLFFQSRKLSLVNNYLGNRGTRHLRAGAHIQADGHIGLFGYYAGPKVHLVDPLGLTDPLTARLPIPFGKDWRTGHYGRFVPLGYLEAVQGNGQIEDPDLREYYGHLHNIVSGDLWSWKRIKDIAQFNLGAYDGLKERFVDRSVGAQKLRGAEQVQTGGRRTYSLERAGQSHSRRPRRGHSHSRS